VGSCRDAGPIERGQVRVSGSRVRSAHCLVMKQHMAIEMQFTYDGPPPGIDRFDIHVRCFAA
jgi:hypothetical protein